MPVIDGDPIGKDSLKANKELVLCKDCVHYEKIYFTDLCWHCNLMLQTGSDDFANRRVPPDGYCWRGERKARDMEVTVDAGF